MTLIIAVTCSLLVGFLVGLLTFRVKSRWCPHCGDVLRCPHGHGRVLAQVAGRDAANLDEIA